MSSWQVRYFGQEGAGVDPRVKMVLVFEQCSSSQKDIDQIELQDNYCTHRMKYNLEKKKEDFMSKNIVC